MARARNIKPSFFQNEDLASLPPLARLFFVGLWTVADHKGCVEFRPKRLKVQLLPYDECDAEALAINLERSGFVRMYSVEGKAYLKVINFERHQNPHKNERDSGSEIPDIDQRDDQVIDPKEITKNREQDGTAPDCDGTAPADSLLLIPDSPILKTPSGAPAPKAPKFDPRRLDLPAGLSQDKWCEWVSYRSKRRPALTEETAAKQLALLGSAISDGHSADEMIEASIRNGWQGLFLPKPVQRPPAARSAMNRIGIDSQTPEGWGDGSDL